MSRELTFTQAVREATDQCMAADAAVYVMGLGVTDPKGIFGTTLGLEEKYGSGSYVDIKHRSFEPLSAIEDHVSRLEAP